MNFFRSTLVAGSCMAVLEGCQQPYMTAFRQPERRTTTMVDVSRDVAPSVQVLNIETRTMNEMRTQRVPEARVLAAIQHAFSSLCDRAQYPSLEGIRLRCVDNQGTRFRLGEDGMNRHLQIALQDLARELGRIGPMLPGLALSITLAGGADRLRSSQRTAIRLANSYCRRATLRSLTTSNPCDALREFPTTPLTQPQRDASNNILAWARATGIGNAFAETLETALPGSCITMNAYGVGTSFQSTPITPGEMSTDPNARRVDIVVTATVPARVVERRCPGPTEALTTPNALYCFQEASQHLAEPQTHSTPSPLSSRPDNMQPEPDGSCIVFDQTSTPVPSEHVNRVLREQFQIQDANRCHPTRPPN